MNINYAKIGKSSGRLSLNSDLMQINRSSQNNQLFTNQFSVSLHQSKQTFNKNNISQVDIDRPYKDSLISSKQEREYKRKKFSFDDQNKMKNFLNSIDEYIEKLEESSVCHTVTINSQSKQENMLLFTFNILQKRQELLKIKYKKLQQNYAIEYQENQNLKDQIIDLKQKLNLEKKKQRNKELKQKYQYLLNSYIKLKLYYDQNSQSIQENNILIDLNQTNQMMDYNNIKQILQSQILKLKYNNRQIDNYSKLYKKQSDHNIVNF